MLIKGGANSKEAFYPALHANCVELVHFIKGEDQVKNKSFDEIQLMQSIVNLPRALDECTNKAINDLKQKIPELDGTTMRHMIARGVDFTKPERLQVSSREPAIMKLAQYGLTEIMSEIVFSAKLFDNTEFIGPIADTPGCGWDNIRPILQVACQRPIWNMDMEKNNFRETGNVIQGPTAPHILAEGDFWWQVEALRYLVENEVASTFNKSRTGLNRKFFRSQCCEALLELGANSNKINPDGLTALNKAGSDEEIIRILLKYGGNVNAGTKGILSAIETGSVKAVQLYLENRADPNIPDNSTSSSCQARNQRLNVFNKFPILVASLPNGSRANFESISGAVDMVQLLLDYGARIDLPIDDKETILHYIFANATSATLLPFIEISAIDANSRDQSGRTVLLAAITNPTTMEEEHGYIANEDRDTQKSEYTPPFIHLLNSSIHGPSLDYLAVDNEGRHIIFYLLSRWTDETAFLIFSIPCIRSLVTQTDFAGYSPLHRALELSPCSSPCNKIINLFLEEEGTDLLDPGPNLGRPNSVSTDSIPLMNQYLDLGGDINARNDVGMTPLLAYLAAGGYQSNLPWFKEHGADLKVTNHEGEGALHIVAKRRIDRSSPYLWHKVIKEGDPNARLFGVLVKEYGCEVLDEDEKGRTALDIAAAMGNQEILKLFQRSK
ncbi:hypothetical protein NHQ30_009920 [Ciborinia camelliae]|nr:hypothetical protein NHQ30_009920 [Ciborinia camelliae]